MRQQRYPSCGSQSFATSCANTSTNTSPERPPREPAPAGRARLDLVLVRRGLVETRERAQSLILSGAVRVNQQKVGRVSHPVCEGDLLEVTEASSGYVSRGAHKLTAALDRWAVDVNGRVALDVGASTGGFTDVLLKRGAAHVYAVDVGYGQLHYALRQDSRVTVMERTNIRYLTALPETPQVAVADVSFISLRLALPPIFNLISPDALVITLIKPQFEAGRAQVGKGGVVRSPAVHRSVIADLITWSASEEWHLHDVTASPLRGPAGNVEFLGMWRRGVALAPDDTVRQALEAAPVPAGTAP